MNIVIDRNRWARGLEQFNYLSSEDGMCCLGFVAKQCGCEDIWEIKLPSAMSDEDKKLFEQFYNPSSTILIEMACINDSTSLSDQERETQLIKIFAKYGHTLTFKGKA